MLIKRLRCSFWKQLSLFHFPQLMTSHAAETGHSELQSCAGQDGVRDCSLLPLELPGYRWPAWINTVMDSNASWPSNVPSATELRSPSRGCDCFETTAAWIQTNEGNGSRPAVSTDDYSPRSRSSSSRGKISTNLRGDAIANIKPKESEAVQPRRVGKKFDGAERVATTTQGSQIGSKKWELEEVQNTEKSARELYLKNLQDEERRLYGNSESDRRAAYVKNLQEQEAKLFALQTSAGNEPLCEQALQSSAGNEQLCQQEQALQSSACNEQLCRQTLQGSADNEQLYLQGRGDVRVSLPQQNAQLLEEWVGRNFKGSNKDDNIRVVTWRSGSKIWKLEEVCNIGSAVDTASTNDVEIPSTRLASPPYPSKQIQKAIIASRPKPAGAQHTVDCHTSSSSSSDVHIPGLPIVRSNISSSGSSDKHVQEAPPSGNGHFSRSSSSDSHVQEEHCVEDVPPEILLPEGLANDPDGSDSPLEVQYVSFDDQHQRHMTETIAEELIGTTTAVGHLQDRQRQVRDSIEKTLAELDVAIGHVHVQEELQEHIRWDRCSVDSATRSRNARVRGHSDGGGIVDLESSVDSDDLSFYEYEDADDDLPSVPGSEADVELPSDQDPGAAASKKPAGEQHPEKSLEKPTLGGLQVSDDRQESEVVPFPRHSLSSQQSSVSLVLASPIIIGGGEAAIWSSDQAVHSHEPWQEPGPKVLDDLPKDQTVDEM